MARSSSDRPWSNSVTITPALVTGAFGAADSWFEFTAVPEAAPAPDQMTYLTGIQVRDLDDNAAAAQTFYFSNSASASLAASNSVAALSDGDAATVQGIYIMASASWDDPGANKMATNPVPIKIPMKPVAGTTTVYCAAKTAGTPTQTTAGQVTVTLFFQDR